MNMASKEQRMEWAHEAFHKGQFKSKTACTKAFDLNENTFRNRLNGISSRKDSIANSRKLSDLEEETLSKWILDMAERGLPPQISRVRYLAKLLLSARLKNPSTAFISKRWVSQFVERPPEIKSKYNCRYDYQRAKREDPKDISEWFALVRNTIEKYGILEQDIYNMDVTGFQMGVISTSKVFCGSETRNKHARSIQPGNREWVTSVVTVNSTG